MFELLPLLVAEVLPLLLFVILDGDSLDLVLGVIILKQIRG